MLLILSILFYLSNKKFSKINFRFVDKCPIFLFFFNKIFNKIFFISNKTSFFPNKNLPFNTFSAIYNSIRSACFLVKSFICLQIKNIPDFATLQNPFQNSEVAFARVQKCFSAGFYHFAAVFCPFFLRLWHLQGKKSPKRDKLWVLQPCKNRFREKKRPLLMNKSRSRQSGVGFASFQK